MFVIPEDLTVFSVAGLADLKRVADAELATLTASITDPEQVTDEQLSRGEELKAFSDAAQTEISKRSDRAGRFSALTPAVEQPAAEVEQPAAEVEQPAAEVVTASTEVAVAEPVVPAQRVSVSQMASHTSLAEVPANTQEATFTIIAAADIPGVPAGQELASLRDVSKAFIARTRSYAGSQTKTRHSIATIERNLPAEFTLLESDSDEAMHAKLLAAGDETRLEGNSLVAANGWCAPSETLYSTVLQVSTDGMLDVPEVVARRGGIRHNQGIDFSTLFGNDFVLPIPGFNILTEAQVIADTAKTLVEIPCPAFVDDRLKVAALGLTGAILQNRAYPEFVNTFVNGAIAAMAHLTNRDVIADIVAGSTAVSLGTVDPWVSDASVVSQVVSAVETAIVDIKYRLRLPMSATVEIVLPFWLKAQMRADWIRRNAGMPADMADAMIDEMFRIRGARAQYVYDWQDAFDATAGGPGGATALLTLPESATANVLKFLAYPAGTWVVARQDVIRIDSLYDSVNLQQNLVTQLFQEDGYAAMRMAPLSRVYSINMVPSGSTGVQRAVVATDVTP